MISHIWVLILICIRFVGLGLLLFGLVSISILKGVGLLVICIGVGSLVAGYIYPNNSHEIAEAVEKFEKK